jgi:GPH family glycoside/pentoside/hexuronide:cation symporter
MFGAVYWWMVKLGTAAAMLTSGIVLHYIGFNEAVQVQTAEAITNLRIADIVIPIFAGILAILIMWKYDINEAKSNEIREELILRRGERKTMDEIENAAKS